MTRRAATPTTDKPPAKATAYEISVPGEPPNSTRAWLPVGEILTSGGARTAIRKWAEANADFAGGDLRAIPKSNITTVTVAIETKRQLTLGAP